MDGNKVEEPAAEIARLNELIKKYPKTSAVAQDAMFRLAIMYSQPSNPSPDYENAILLFQSYVECSTNEELKNTALHINSLLKQLLKAKAKIRQEEEKVKSVRAEQKELQKANRTLLEENESMKRTIEELKALDLQLDKQRKKIW